MKIQNTIGRVFPVFRDTDVVDWGVWEAINVALPATAASRVTSQTKPQPTRGPNQEHHVVGNLSKSAAALIGYKNLNQTRLSARTLRCVVPAC